jgi:hypothetical protein
MPVSVAEPYTLREYLADWIEQYPEEERHLLRARVISNTLPLLRSAAQEPAIWTICAIGFRSPDIERALLRVARSNSAAGNAAISCLAALHPGNEVKEALVRKAVRRLAERRAGTLDLAVQELASPQFLSALSRTITHPMPDSASSGRDRSWDLLRKFGLLGRIAEREPNNRALQERVWQAFKSAVHGDGASQRSALFLATGMASCNTAEVTTSLLRALCEPNANCYLICKRLQDCVLPQQLLGWHQTNGAQLKKAITQFATVSIGGTSNGTTPESHLRDLIWEIALAAGIADVDDWLARLLETETNPYQLRQIISFASYLQLDHVPPRIEALVRERIDIRQGTTEPFVGARIEAAQVLRAAPSHEALEILLSSGLTFQGSSLRRISEAVADVAERLSRHNGDRVFSRLIELSESPPSEHSRILAIVGLQRVAATAVAPERVIRHFLKLANDPTLPAYARAYVVWSLGGVSAASASQVVDCLLAYAENAEADHELRFQSLDGLVRLGRWKDHEPTFLRALGIPHPGATVPRESLRVYQPWQGLILANLFQFDPGAYYLPLSDLIAHGRGNVVHIALRTLGDRAAGAGKLLTNLATAAIRRARDQIGKSFGETDNFEAICRIAPDEFVDAGWENIWDDWMPPVRASVADAINGSFPKLPPEGQRHAFALLELLLGDSTYQVRRSAGRAYSKCDRNRFEELVAKWANSGPIELRRRAAEMAQWLPPDDDEALDNHIIRLLQHDPEPSVREASKRSLEAVRHSVWRAAYINRIVTERSDDGNAWVSKAFCYGRALTKVGDDETVVAIRDLELNTDVPPNVQNWLRSVREDLESHWQEVTRSWPEPWLPWSGQLEEVPGAVRIGTDVSPVRLSLWYRRPDDPRKLASWGGAFQAGPTLRPELFTGLSPGSKIDITIEGRGSASAFVSSVNLAGDVLFLGTGRYPDVS